MPPEAEHPDLAALRAARDDAWVKHQYTIAYFADHPASAVAAANVAFARRAYHAASDAYSTARDEALDAALRGVPEPPHLHHPPREALEPRRS